MTLHSSMWAHPRRLLAAELTDISTDAFPPRLASLGYETVFISGSNPNFDNMMPWLRRWYSRLVYDVPGNALLYTRRLQSAVQCPWLRSECQRQPGG